MPIRDPLKFGFNHPSQQKGWRDSSAGVGFSKGQLQDEDYHEVLAIHNYLWRYITTHYPKENQCPIAVLGYAAIPIAIELSQWTYPITYITNTYEGVVKAKKDCEIQAGSFQDLLYFDFYKNCPRVRVIAFIGALEGLQPYEIHDYLDLLLRRSNEIVCAVSIKRDWTQILGGKFDYRLKMYPKGVYYLLTIKSK